MATVPLRNCLLLIATLIPFHSEFLASTSVKRERLCAASLCDEGEKASSHKTRVLREYRFLLAHKIGDFLSAPFPSAV